VATSAYSISAPTATARLPGRVQGVVVQITANCGSFGTSTPKACARCSLSATGKATSIAGEVLSSYSTSASASAEPQSMHQFTGLRPRYSRPFFQILPMARISAPSVAGSIVLYGWSQSPSTPRRWKSTFCRSICSAA
jgi:hypothetical protein